MSASCCHTSTKKGRSICPSCGQSCFPVSKKTILQQVGFPDNQSIAECGYTFCANRDCVIGYFSISDKIPKARLRAFRFDQETMICHCFDISESVYRAALTDGTAEAMKAFVVQQTKDGLCACEFRNPSGRCCLVDFRQIEKRDDC